MKLTWKGGTIKVLAGKQVVVSDSPKSCHDGRKFARVWMFSSSKYRANQI